MGTPNSPDFSQRPLTFPWNPVSRSQVMLELFVERNVGFKLDKDGITIEMSPGMKAAEVVRMVNDAIDGRLAEKASKRKRL